MARAPKYALAAMGIWAVLAAPAESAEWRSWCGEGLGWHFYCDRSEELRETPPAPGPPTDSASQSATERIMEIRRRLEEARASAILDPSPEKVAAYLRLQQETLQRAAAFSDAFRRTVWATPELDYTLKRPVGALAKRLWSDGRRAEVAASLAKLGERYGLIYLGHPGMRRLPGVRPAAARVRNPPRPRRAGGVADRRAARRLARGRARQRAGRKSSVLPARRCRPWCCSTPGRGTGPSGRLRRHGRGPARRTDIYADRPGARP